MLRGYRRFILAVVGILIAATAIWTYLKPAYPIIPTSEYQKAEDTEYSPGNPRCYPSRLDSLSDREAADERYRCEQVAEQHRLKSDDLVQQTRSAEAAVALVGLTYNQSLMLLAGTIFGLLTLVAAFAAVLYAKRAADAAADTLSHAKNTAARELRPWVSVGVIAKRVVGGPAYYQIEFDVVCTNLGQTVAKEFRMYSRMIFAEDNPREAVQDWWRKWQEPTEVVRTALMPGEENVSPMFATTAKDKMAWRVTGLDGKQRAMPIVVVSVFYRTDLDEHWHRTDRAYSLGEKGETMGCYITEGIENLSADELAVRPYSGSLAT
ncbi:MAG: hypothetical protein QOI38_2757 [Sphingomonadales bacterium]|jgi:hypothetical protein|nr:hypothetical protein [Sphingomonadales bacterium]